MPLPYNATILGLRDDDGVAGKAACDVLSALVVTYLFLGGAGAGACFVLGMLGLLVPRDEICAVDSRPVRRLRFSPRRPYASFFVVGYTAALMALAVGAVCLMADLGRADRIVLLFVNPTPTLINAGTWAIACSVALVCALLAAWGSVLRCPVFALRIMQAASVGVALFVMFYTGLLLSSIAAVPLWNSVWIPVLFVLSAFSCGIALVTAAAQVSSTAAPFRRAMRALVSIDAVAIVFEAAALAALVAFAAADVQQAANQTLAAEAASVGALVQGDAAWAFWGLLVAAGLFVPLCLEAAFLSRSSGSMRPASSFCTAACVLVGGFALRACIVWAGVHPVVSSASAILIG